MKLLITESQNKELLRGVLEKRGVRMLCKILNKNPRELFSEIGIKRTEEDALFLTKVIMDHDVDLNYCSYEIIPINNTIQIYIYISMHIEDHVPLTKERVCEIIEEAISDSIFKLSTGIINNHEVHVSATGDC